MTFVNLEQDLSLSAADAAYERLALLDDPLEWASFSQPQAGQEACWASSVVFEGMHCAACAISIEDALRQVPGVKEVQVSAASHRGRIVWSSRQTRPSQWMQAAASAGYKALPANDAHAHERRRREARRMVWRVAVAGLCMMQVMMYATPAYVADPGDITPDMVQLLRWASWVLSLPVVLFSCTPFLAAAWNDLRQRRIGMDLPVAIGMLGTFVVSSLGTFEPEGPFGAEVYFDSLSMFVFFLLLGRWMDHSARRLWAQVRRFHERRGALAPLLVGALWALMPCGLLYSALMVAALTSSAADGALTMGLFALGSSVSLWAGPWLWLRLQTLGDGAWGMRLAGLALFAVSAWGLWMGLVHDQAPWCATPA